MNDIDRRFLLGGLAGAAGVSALAAMAKGGPLAPPAGPVASTAKPLAEIEPRTAISAVNTPGDANSLFKITQPGSYYLTGNITGVIGKHGVEIAAHGVTLDLNGFDLVGVSGMGDFDGVSSSLLNMTNVTVINGSVRNWGGRGVDLVSAGSTACRIEGVLASGNAGRGIAAGVGSTVANCAAYNNGDGGIATLSDSTVTGCAVYDNTGDGIVGGNNTAIVNCSAAANSGNGIAGANAVLISGCAARNNSLSGIECSIACLITANTCTSNVGAGIHTFGADNRIESNNCTSCARGIDVDSAGNLIVRNSCSGNATNWTIAANNVCGPIIDRTAPASAAVNGNSAPDSTGSTHPNANFTY
jgi:parallel beta-helix repeat protein